MVCFDVDAPPSSWGLIIGTNGAVVKKLQTDFDVRIVISKNNEQGSVVVKGRQLAHCRACEAEIQKIVTSNSRGKDRQKRSSGTSVKCTLCDADCGGSAATIFRHLCSSRHLQKVSEERADLAAVVTPGLDIMDFADALDGDSHFGAFHEELGFNVDALLQQALVEHDRRARAAPMLEEIEGLDNVEWMLVEDRHVVGWDGSCQGLTTTVPLRKAPPLDDMVARCRLGARPPLVRVPKNFPAALPRMDTKRRRDNELKRRHIYPAEVSGMRLAIAASHCGATAPSSSSPLPVPGDFDFVCGTSFIKALAGDSQYTKEEFFLQRVPLPSTARGSSDRRVRGGTVCVLHVPSRTHEQDDTGHAVERLLCGTAGAATTYCALTALRIRGARQPDGGGVRLLVCSEVDATSEDGSLVEIKSSRKSRGEAFVDPKVALQVAVNGSKFVLGCGLDKEGEKVESVEWLQARDDVGGIVAGKRVRVSLDLVQFWLHEAECEAERREACAPVFRLAFDDIKAPIVERAQPDSGVEVVPRELL